jgi:hypothetical protein
MVQGLNPGGGEILRTCPDRSWVQPSLLCNRYWVFPRGKEWPGRDTDPSPPSSAVVMKEYSYTSTPRMGRTEPHCLYKGVLYSTFYLLKGILSLTNTCHYYTVPSRSSLTLQRYITDISFILNIMIFSFLVAVIFAVNCCFLVKT